MSRDAVTRPFAWFAAAVASGAVVLFYKTVGLSVLHPEIFLILIVAVLLSENYALEVPGVGSTSISYPLALAGLLIMGPAAGAVIAAISGLNLRDIVDRRPWPLIVFNVAQLFVSAAVAGFVYLSLGGRLLLAARSNDLVLFPFESGDFPAVVAPLAACAITSLVLNDSFVALGRHLISGQSFFDVWRNGLLWMVPTQAAVALVGFTIAQVLSVQILAFLLFIFPLVVARQVYQNYLSLKTAYAETVSSLVNALEAKDPYTRGHSERVAHYAMQLAKTMGFNERGLETVRQAAIFHDLGKLSTPRRVLAKTSGLTDEEFSIMRRHATAGAQMVDMIPLYRDIGPYVAAHHEWFDGRGYSEELMGEEIPLISRILSVADSYDAMTTARSYRPKRSHSEALEELRRCSGSQFDPRVVTAFIASGIGVISRNTPERIPETCQKTDKAPVREGRAPC